MAPRRALNAGTKGRRITTAIDLDGPFFRYDPAKRFRQNIGVLMDALAEQAEADVKVQLKAGESGRAPISHGVVPARLSGHVVGRTESLKQRNWEVTAVISINNQGFTKAQGTALMAAASRVEGETHAFRRTTGRLRRAKKINAAELLKGIAGGR